ncbi:hypothetical protein TUM20985_12870 [Mycobacterium antarcticum]|nr:hypothetical protein TUM20985_12870 [Mycolicibacterium sp. TUM20985]GLP74104.1 hypothetical protein TUM20983_12140 [Mycolicibacterium sp. TUM20983]GLP79888.1 hypothetical protein TUM20984_13080 [Mycolicibacterium sp. TUM20984]
MAPLGASSARTGSQLPCQSGSGLTSAVVVGVGSAWALIAIGSDIAIAAIAADIPMARLVRVFTFWLPNVSGRATQSPTLAATPKKA